MLLFLFYRWVNWHLEGLNNFPGRHQDLIPGWSDFKAVLWFSQKDQGSTTGGISANGSGNPAVTSTGAGGGECGAGWIGQGHGGRGSPVLGRERLFVWLQHRCRDWHVWCSDKSSVSFLTNVPFEPGYLHPLFSCPSSHFPRGMGEENFLVTMSHWLGR